MFLACEGESGLIPKVDLNLDISGIKYGKAKFTLMRSHMYTEEKVFFYDFIFKI